MRRWVRASNIAWALLAFVALALLLSATLIRTRAGQLLTVLSEYRFVVAVLIGLHAALLISARRQRHLEQARSSWLVAAPLAPFHLRTWMLVRTGIDGLIHISVVAAVTLLLGLLTARLPQSLALLGVVSVAFIAGALVGACLPNRRRLSREGSRYAPRPRAAGHWVSPTAEGLNRWPVAQALSWQRPDNARIGLVIALFAVQGGSSMATGIAVVSTWLLAIYLLTLVQAAIHVGRSAAQWLRSTPMTFVEFAWPIAHRVLLHQLIGGLVIAGLSVVLGLEVLTAICLLALWLTTIATLLCVSLADSFCQRRSWPKLIVAGAISAVIELREQGWVFPALIALGVWHVHRASRMQQEPS